MSSAELMMMHSDEEEEDEFYLSEEEMESSEDIDTLQEKLENMTILKDVDITVDNADIDTVFADNVVEQAVSEEEENAAAAVVVEEELDVDVAAVVIEDHQQLQLQQQEEQQRLQQQEQQEQQRLQQEEEKQRQIEEEIQRQKQEEEEIEKEKERLTKQLQHIQELQQKKLKERLQREEEQRLKLLEIQERQREEEERQRQLLLLEAEEERQIQQEIADRERLRQQEIQRQEEERLERERMQQENERISAIRHQETRLRSGILPLPSPSTRFPRIPGIQNPNLLLTIHGARKLIKRSIFSTPDPFCIISIDGINQIRSTSIRTKTLNPQFNTSFNFLVEPSSIIVIQIFDHKLFTSPGTGQGFLGVINLRIGNFVDLSTLNSRNTAKFTLKSSTGHQDVRGTIDVSFKCIIPLSTPAYLTPSMANTSSSGSSPLLAGGGSTVAAPQNDTLPPGWTSARDSQNRLYYINHNDRTTSWTKPSLPSPASPTPSEDLLRREQFDRRQDASSSSSATLPTPSTTTSDPATPSQSDLPPGWERRISPSGRPYYVDHNTSKTTWDHPGGSQGQTPPPPPQAMSPSASSFDHLIKGEDVRYTVNSQADLDEITQNSIRELGKLPSGWQLRVASNGRIFFLDHGTKNTTWDDPRIVPMADSDAPKYKADFQMKLRLFRVAPELRVLEGESKIEVSRQNLFYDAFDQVMARKPVELKKKLYIVFNNELGLDYGGVAREFFYNLSHEIFNPIYGLFQCSSQNNYVLQVNPHSYVNPEHLQYFYFIGLVIGMAIFNKKYLDATFVTSFYKMILDIPVALEDLESVDAMFYKNLLWMIDNDVTYLGQTFSAADEVFGEITNYDLVENGSEIDVTEENKMEYIKKIVDFRLINRVQEQMNEIKRGIFDIIPKNLLERFNETELEFLFCGVSEIDISDWRTHTLYRKCDTDSQIIKWFWEVVGEDLDNLKRAQLLQFVTGTSRLPLNGFKDLQGSDGPRKFTIELLVNASTSEFPRSHTCFNRIDLPPYSSKKELSEKMMMAIECSEGFDQK